MKKEVHTGERFNMGSPPGEVTEMPRLIRDIFIGSYKCVS